tara:strand:- start:113 stop:1453 length:1341 start_codon:yes stop_codon:yes gene_type:complete
MENASSSEIGIQYAGFWRRFLAFLIDYNLVLIIALILVLFLSMFEPAGYKIESPFGIFKNTEVVESDEVERPNLEGANVKIETTVTKETEFGYWEYIYQKEKTTNGDETDTEIYEILDGEKIKNERTDKGSYLFFILLFYYCLFESSRLQATPGKLLLSIKVSTTNAGRPTIPQTIARNLSKILSCLTIFIGFLLAGFTQKKQALHDKLTDLLVVDKTTEPKSLDTDSYIVSGEVSTAWIKTIALSFLIISFSHLSMGYITLKMAPYMEKMLENTVSTFSASIKAAGDSVTFSDEEESKVKITSQGNTVAVDGDSVIVTSDSDRDLNVNVGGTPKEVADELNKFDEIALEMMSEIFPLEEIAPVLSMISYMYLILGCLFFFAGVLFLIGHAQAYVAGIGVLTISILTSIVSMLFWEWGFSGLGLFIDLIFLIVIISLVKKNGKTLQ